jgi:hypothetical protein
VGKKLGVRDYFVSIHLMPGFRQKKRGNVDSACDIESHSLRSFGYRPCLFELKPHRFVVLLIALIWATFGLTERACGDVIDRSAETPDLMQSNPEAGLPDRGAPYCGPVAASNSFIWLSRNGYPGIAPANVDTPGEQGRLVMRLAREMNTTKRGGTTPDGFLKGIERYVQNTGYKIDSMKYQGWEVHPKRFSGMATDPDPALVRQTLTRKKTAAWLKIGWYKYFRAEDKYVRFAGHWVTVVGCRETTGGGIDFIVHDPAARSGAAPANEIVSLKPITHGKLLTGFDGNKARDAKGFFQLGGDLKIKQRADTAILDGIVVLQLR